MKLPRYFGDTSGPPLKNNKFCPGEGRIISGIWNPPTQAKNLRSISPSFPASSFFPSFQNIFKKHEISEIGPEASRPTRNLRSTLVFPSLLEGRGVRGGSRNTSFQQFAGEISKRWIVWYPRTQETWGRTSSHLLPKQFQKFDFLNVSQPKVSFFFFLLGLGGGGVDFCYFARKVL